MCQTLGYKRNYLCELARGEREHSHQISVGVAAFGAVGVKSAGPFESKIWAGRMSGVPAGMISSPVEIIATRGWTEAYLWAVELCRKLGIGSVANCSFGGLS